ncbi:hypothetical protein E1B28_002325 [Marasmius oreades]|uniref:SLC41A/MgtE integral membrane domain-containing protein n=1 Tax=Marasmius oreades TaxID=181124 RepID=A0A9P7RNF3_9AGAR|nr:uncharacterized protein E1B28_002325 [Marasmius oreades]KAG7086365.1 hypothetical protein E1B28_002325 [Marasmius oreades]
MSREVGSYLERNGQDNIELEPLHRRNDSYVRTGRDNVTSYDEENSDEETRNGNLNDDEEALLGSSQSSKVIQGPVNRWSQVKNIVIESAPTLLFTTLGLLFTGKLLDQVSHWRPMKTLDQLIITIPIILNLKGNLEMNLSARLATAANAGDLNHRKTRREVVLGNLALLQVQAAVVSFVAASLAFLLGFLLPIAAKPAGEQLARSAQQLLRRRPLPHPTPSEPLRKTTVEAFLTVVTTCILSASLSSLLLGSLMSGIVLICLRFSLDPDNIAPPIASCLGDLVTLCLIGVTSTILVPFMYNPAILSIPIIMVLMLVLLLIIWVSCLILALKNRHVRPLLTQGWSPLFGAMVISSGTGMILDLFVSRYQGFALLAVVISGLPGAVGAIFTSRLSTALHLESIHENRSRHVNVNEEEDAPKNRSIGHRPEENGAVYPTPSSSRAPSPQPNGPSSSNHEPHPTPALTPGTYTPPPSPKLVTITLLLITLPVELVFLSVLKGLGWLRLPIFFVLLSVGFFCVAVLISLYFARILTTFLWARGRDPDTYALPIHSAMMDLVGQSLLVLCFEIVRRLGIL